MTLRVVLFLETSFHSRIETAGIVSLIEMKVILTFRPLLRK